ncbi:MAG: peptidoglycan editing factor PgeF [Rhodocyclales bacterium]|nr:peptidoglycan editing factor PgeF [Rhodocyclales bacterium]
MKDWIVPDWPAPAKVRALVTTRAGGVSAGPYASLNLAAHVGDDPAAVAENRRRLRAYLPAEPLWLTQVHGNAVARAGNAVAGVEADAAVACGKGAVCAILTADCLPVLLCNDVGTAVGAAHAGWRGLAGGVIEAAVRAMNEPPPRLLAWLGPAIGPQAFEVGQEVREVFVAHAPDAAAAFAAKENGKWLADLYRLATLRLNALGVDRVFGGGRCTFLEADSFYSYRREKTTGRMASLIWLE